MTFHPDKHTEETKEFAEQKFHLIQKAYDVLSDVNKRHIYDLYGDDGLDDGWNITVAMDKDQLRQEYERRAAFRKEMEEQSKVKSRVV
jgi:DnaJ homolog subfamily C member 11